MAFKINGTTISLTRGDTLRVKIDIINPDGSIHVPESGDSVRFAMKAKYTDKDPVLEKDIPTDTLLLVLNPNDTKTLKMPFDYVYDIEYTYANGDVDTFIDKAKFKITEEVD